MKTPFLLLLEGMTGAGKSTTAGLLAKQIPRLATIGIDNVKLLISDFERGDRDNNLAREIIFSMTKRTRKKEFLKTKLWRNCKNKKKKP